MKLGNVALGLFFVGLGALMFWSAQDFPSAPGSTFGAGLFPSILAGGFVACGGILIVQSMYSGERQAWLYRPDWTRDRGAALRFFLVPGAVLFYIYASPHLGMVVASTLILVGFFAVMRVRPMLAIPVALLVPIVIFLAFSRLLQVPLPQGWLSGILS